MLLNNELTNGGGTQPQTQVLLLLKLPIIRMQV